MYVYVLQGSGCRLLLLFVVCDVIFVHLHDSFCSYKQSAVYS